MKFLRLFLLSYLIIFPGKIFALRPSDFFKENGELVEVKEPPYFNKVPPGVDLLCESYNNYVYIHNYACSSLLDASKVSIWHEYICPPFYWNKDFGSILKPSGVDTFFESFFKRYSPDPEGRSHQSSHDFKVEYSEYMQKFSYLYYWFDLTYDLYETCATREMAKTQERIYPTSAERYQADYLKKELGKLNQYRKKSFEILDHASEHITDSFLCIYDACIQKHAHPTALYQRGQIYFNRGDTLEFVSDIFTLVDMGYKPSPELNIELGKAYNEAHLFDHAIKTLSEEIAKKPHLKEAYFERALAYFEKGNLELALADYLNADQRPSLIFNKDYQHFMFSVGITTGCIKGGFNSALHFVPSLFSTLQGLGKGLWALAGDPVGVSMELVEGTLNCIEYIRDNMTPELLATLVPELKECIEKWDQLEGEQKGYPIGYVIGHYGVDAFMCGGSAKGIQLYRNLKKANAALTLETAVASPAHAKEVRLASQRYFQAREEFKKKCKLHIGRQEKHIPGANNFQEGKSELTMSMTHLEKIASKNLGEGIPTRSNFGEASYKELIDFGEVIGIHVNMDKVTIRTPTKIGEIHYDKKGNYHVVPVHPSRMRINNGKN